MLKHPSLLLDDLVTWYSTDLIKGEPRKKSAHSQLSRIRPDVPLDFRLETGMRRGLSTSLDKSQLILINGAVADSLYFLDQSQVNYDSLDHLPFGTMFFELMQAVPFEMEMGVEAPLKAILFGKAKDVSPICSVFGDSVLKAPDGSEMNLFYAGLFFEGMNRFDLPNEIIFTPEDLRKGNNSIRAIELASTTDYSHLTADKVYNRLINLCVNIVSYINAHNVTIVKTERDNPYLPRINRKRAQKGHKQIKPLHPIHWIDIKQSTHYSRERQRLEEEGRTLEYQEIVRGHFQRYHTNDGVVKLWRDPFRRGPEDAPWRNNRYRLLDTLLKQGTKF
ncbi:hypothetical protein COY27_02870 [Candidatus Woesearchaeota archaeon CG_4_10_14_0_2_um_filter_33_13]|nr:MAG: hypothetical protein COY27_02870 [Candidatus Woesearchaeota archaeon CG_4_10_14_0_2_um_filter_33_13]